MKRDCATHPKTIDLAVRLGRPNYVAIGVLEGLFQFTNRFCPTGDVTQYMPDAFARSIEWDGASKALLDALIGARYIDKRGKRFSVHNWSEHADRAVHMVLARQRKFFADGEKPTTSHLPKDEARDAAEWYTQNVHAVYTKRARRDRLLHSTPLPTLHSTSEPSTSTTPAPSPAPPRPPLPAEPAGGVGGRGAGAASLKSSATEAEAETEVWKDVEVPSTGDCLKRINALKEIGVRDSATRRELALLPHITENLIYDISLDLGNVQNRGGHQIATHIKAVSASIQLLAAAGIRSKRLREDISRRRGMNVEIIHAELMDVQSAEGIEDIGAVLAERLREYQPADAA